MCRVFFGSFIVILLLSLGTGHSLAQAGDTTPPPDEEELSFTFTPAPATNLDDYVLAEGTQVPLAAIKGFPAKLRQSTHYTIDEYAEIKDGFYSFKVKSPHAEYTITGLQNLRNTLKEIEAIETFPSYANGSQILRGAGKVVLDIPLGAVMLVRNPVGAIKALGRNPVRTVRALGKLASSPFRQRKRRSPHAPKQYKPGDIEALFVSEDIRRAAAQMGVDPYTRNPNMQKLLLGLARHRTTGSFLIRYATPSTYFLTSFRHTLTPGAKDVPTEQMISENGHLEMRRLNARLYKDNLGLVWKKHAGVTRLLKNKKYTPGQAAYIQHFLTNIGKVPHLNAAIDHLAKADSFEQASYNTAQLELISVYHKQISKVKDLIVLPDNQLGLYGSDNKVAVLLPYDIVPDTMDMLNIVIDAKQIAEDDFKTEQVEFWFTGDVEKSFAKSALEEGVSLRRERLDGPIFSPK